MADNIAVTPGTGAIVAADDIGGVLHQRVKLGLGADGTAVDALAGAGAVSTGVQRVTLASDDPAVTTLGVVGAAGSVSGSMTQQLRFIAGTGIPITGSVTVGTHAVTIASGGVATGANSIAAVEDSAAATGDTALKGLVSKRLDTPANLSDTDGDYEFLQMSAGRLWTSATVTAVPADPFGVNADAASLSTSISAKLKGIATALGITAFDLGAGTGGSRSLRVYIDSSQVAPAGDKYETVAASQTAQALGATGATGDYLSGVLVIPATTSPGVVTLLDNATSIPLFVGGASSVSNLVPFFIPVGAKSVSGAWKLTTGANVSAIGIGTFT